MKINKSNIADMAVITASISTTLSYPQLLLERIISSFHICEMDQIEETSWFGVGRAITLKSPEEHWFLFTA